MALPVQSAVTVMMQRHTALSAALQVQTFREAQAEPCFSAAHDHLSKLASVLALVVLPARVGAFGLLFVQDTVNALLLCESVYKAADNGPEAAERALTAWKRQFGDACTLTEVQCSLPHVAHRSVRSLASVHLLDYRSLGPSCEKRL